MDNFWGITSEEVYEGLAPSPSYIEVLIGELPCAQYLGNDIWLGVDGLVYKVVRG